jgi:hypothetical protein
MRDVPLREGMVRNVTADRIKDALRAAGLPDTHSPLVFTAMAVKVGNQLALIDSGTGGHPIYGEGNGKLLQSMAAAGLDPKAVKDDPYFPSPWRPHLRPARSPTSLRFQERTG